MKNGSALTISIGMTEMSEFETLKSEISTLNNRLSDLKNQVKKKKLTAIECKYPQRLVFAQRLKQALKEMKITQVELAEKIGMTQGGYTSYEQARREPPIKVLVQLADKLNVSLDWLCGRTEKI